MHTRSADHTASALPPPAASPDVRPLPDAPEIWLIAAPPFGAPLFDGVVRRLGQGIALSVLDPAHPDDGWRERGAALAARMRGAAGPIVMVAHGLAVPAAIEAARLASPLLLVLSNGPMTRLDPVSRGLVRIGRGALAAAMRPGAWLRWLSSSAGLRRAVVNPYVMDHDTVATVCGGVVATRADRQAAAAYVSSLAVGLPALPSPTVETRLLWGDDDHLYPSSEADFADAALGGGCRLSVPGGRFGHPIERPWAMADAVAGEMARIVTSPATLTATSRSGIP